MDAMLAGLDFSVAYLNDILIRSKDRKKDGEHIENIYERIKDFSFKVSDNKCEFFIICKKYLGQINDTNCSIPNNFVIKIIPPPN